MEKYPNGTTMPSLSNQVAEFPTPRSCSAMAATITEKTANAEFPNLETVVAQSIYPTPQATDGSVGSVIADDDEFFYNDSGNLRKVNGKGTEGSAGLARKVMIESWPTPRQCEAEGGVISNCEYEDGSFFRENKKGVRFGVKLKDAVDMFPTPRAAKGMAMKLTQGMADLQWKGYLETEIAHQEKAPGSHLNPEWTERLMLWPTGWTGLEPLTELDWDIDGSLWERDDVPRVKPKEKDHANRLKAIGNGQVSLCAAVAWKILE